MRQRWEALDPKLQAAIAFPALWVFFFLLHLGPFAQPISRALLYAFFWGAIFTAGVVLATRAEKQRRG